MIDSLSINSTGLSKLYRFFYTNNASTRLRLDSLTGQLEPIPGTNNYKEEKYSFIYNTDPWSSGTTFLYAQDWWGYYNGIGNSTLVPHMPDPIAPSQELPGAERKPDAASMAGGMLTQITYPTGGHTVFTFEPNQEQGYDFGGDTYSTVGQVTAFSNDHTNNNPYYNYDIRNGNPNDTMHVYSAVNSFSLIPVRLIAHGLRNGSNPPPPANDFVSANIYLKDSQGLYTQNIYSITNTDTTINLPQGYYQIKLVDGKGQTLDSTASNYVRYSIAAIWVNRLAVPGAGGHTASGLRIAKIADYDGVNSAPFNVKTYKYLLKGGGSSGYLNYQPLYGYDLSVNGGTLEQPANAVYYVRSAFSNFPLATQHGAVVGYYHVEEDLDNNGQKGKNDYYYSITGAEGVSAGVFPFPPPTTLEWHEGLLVRQISSKYTGSGNYAPVQQKVSFYSTINTNSAISIKAGFNPYPFNYIPTVNYLGGNSPQTAGTTGTIQGTMRFQAPT